MKIVLSLLVVVILLLITAYFRKRALKDGVFPAQAPKKAEDAIV